MVHFQRVLKGTKLVKIHVVLLGLVKMMDLAANVRKFQIIQNTDYVRFVEVQREPLLPGDQEGEEDPLTQVGL